MKMEISAMAVNYALDLARAVMPLNQYRAVEDSILYDWAERKSLSNEEAVQSVVKTISDYFGLKGA